MAELSTMMSQASCDLHDAPQDGAKKNPLELCADGLDLILEPLGKWMFAIATLAVGAMSLPIVIDVLARILMGKSLSGVVELEEYLMVVIVFLALGYTQKSGGHIFIDLVTCKLPRKAARCLQTFSLASCSVFFGVMCWRTVLTAMHKTTEYSTMLGIPVWTALALAAIGVAVMCLVLLQQLLRSLSENLQDRAWLGIILALAAAAALLTMPTWLKAIPWEISRFEYGLYGMAFLMVLLLSGMPIGFAMSIVGYIGLGVLGFNLTPALNSLGISPYHTTASFILAVAPLFIFMGLLASEAGISKELFDTAYKWLGRLPGGLAMAAVAGCSGFAAVCGDSMATAVTMGSVALPEMQAKKYKSGLACGALAAGGTLGILIPPSVGFIFYALVTEESVGKLFIAGIVPGVLLALMFIAAIWIIATRHPETAPRGEAVSFGEKLASLKGVIGMLILFVMILGGILGGFFSPTEGGAIGVVGAFLITVVRRKLTWKGLLRACEQTVFITCKLLMILIGVSILGYFMASSRLPFELANVITGSGLNRYLILGGVLLLYIILGCLMNVIPMILLTLPAIFPTILALGFDPIWFGVVTVVIMEVGQITPPVGVNVFALSSVAEGVSMGTIFSGILPFFLCMVLLIGLLIIFPPLATGLVSVFF
ncbi:MAG: TRAP transporter large permease subunit [Desulfarculus sp.]|nr:TRAP transporter large permease subunit [Pseudomonadota bacterium]MBU4574396.1 TRAP transporter large permease subunit [Pseudomonadota bacterium]MBU4597509.1 TRAP transporter large permease subunit [Pseudomonadota bacterium]MBV1718002.1 TRAP transporter large permease subunit [Desulfarculus sp.]MBV1739241.1 TRAP transporter large permease subunit [Desulfarculus sp.]